MNSRRAAGAPGVARTVLDDGLRTAAPRGATPAHDGLAGPVRGSRCWRWHRRASAPCAATRSRSGVPTQRIGSEAQPDRLAVRAHRGFRSGDEVIRVDHHGMSARRPNGQIQLVEGLDPGVIDAHVLFERVPGTQRSPSGRRMRRAWWTSARKLCSLRTMSRIGRLIVSFKKTSTVASCSSHSINERGDSNLDDATSIGPMYWSPSSGSCSASRSPRSSIDRKNAVDRDRARSTARRPPPAQYVCHGRARGKRGRTRRGRSARLSVVAEEVQIRPVMESDLQTVVRVPVGCRRRRGTRLVRFRVDRARELERRWRDDGLIGSDGSYVAVIVDERCAGVVSWHPVARTGNFEIGVALLPEFRGRGIRHRGTAAARRAPVRHDDRAARPGRDRGRQRRRAAGSGEGRIPARGRASRAPLSCWPLARCVPVRRAPDDLTDPLAAEQPDRAGEHGPAQHRAVGAPSDEGT